MFPGQGSQYRGMGKGLFSKYKTETALASSLLGYDLETLCLKDPDKLLGKTQYTQPALYVVNSFVYREQQVVPDYLIGHSLGEYNALLAAEAFDFETGLRLVQKRGALMAAASGGAMAAVLGLSISELESHLAAGGYSEVQVANYNTPTQTVLSGTHAGIEQVIKDFTAMKVKVVPLYVSAPFHSKYMAPAAAEFGQFLKTFRFNPLKIPVIANATARPYGDNQVGKALSQQIDSSVQWTDTIRYLMGQGVSEYLEMGSVILTKMANEVKESCTPIADMPEKVQPSTLTSPTLNGHSSARNTGEAKPQKLGNAAFRADYGINYSYVAGAMYRGTASKAMVIRLGQAGMIGYLGTAGLPMDEIAQSIDDIQAALTPEQAYGMNLIHNLYQPAVELETVQLYLEKGVQNIEAAAFMQITEALVYFRAKGLSENAAGQVACKHRILAKVSRPEVAEVFMKPAPAKLCQKLLDQGLITPTQAKLAQNTPMSHDICVEADSGGHTDGGIATVLLPAIQSLRAAIQAQYRYDKPIRIGLAGGIGTPESAASAFVMGADFILTGSINQCTVEAGTSDAVKNLLADINVQDTAYAPAGDMFEIGAKVQVLRKGVLFPARANKLFSLYNQYESLEAIPEKVRGQLEKNYFKQPIDEIWRETEAYFLQKGRKEEIEKAAALPKHKMALVFRWYFGFSSRIAFAGDTDQKVNFQVHTGPALGAFNQWVKGTALEDWKNRHVDQIGQKLMQETAELLTQKLKEIIH